jgi:hypothetical protein
MENNKEITALAEQIWTAIDQTGHAPHCDTQRWSDATCSCDIKQIELETVAAILAAAFATKDTRIKELEIKINHYEKEHNLPDICCP